MYFIIDLDKYSVFIIIFTVREGHLIRGENNVKMLHCENININITIYKFTVVSIKTYNLIS